jgi:hypothetical protein
MWEVGIIAEGDNSKSLLLLPFARSDQERVWVHDMCVCGVDGSD